jgi:hypothetical protein
LKSRVLKIEISPGFTLNYDAQGEFENTALTSASKMLKEAAGMLQAIVEFNNNLECKDVVKICPEVRRNLTITNIYFLRNLTIIYWFENTELG